MIVRKQLNLTFDVSIGEMFGDIDQVVRAKLEKLAGTCRADCFITESDLVKRSECTIKKSDNKGGVVHAVVNVMGIVFSTKDVVFDAKRIGNTNKFLYDGKVIVSIDLGQADVIDKEKIPIQLSNIAYDFGKKISAQGKIYTVPNDIVVYRLKKTEDMPGDDPLPGLKSLIAGVNIDASAGVRSMLSPSRAKKNMSEHRPFDITGLSNEDRTFFYYPPESFSSGKVYEVGGPDAIKDLSKKFKVREVSGNAVPFVELLLEDYYRYVQVVAFLATHDDYVKNLERYYTRRKVD